MFARLIYNVHVYSIKAQVISVAGGRGSRRVSTPDCSYTNHLAKGTSLWPNDQWSTAGLSSGALDNIVISFYILQNLESFLWSVYVCHEPPVGTVF